jgi:hypothetical protein
VSTLVSDLNLIYLIQNTFFQLTGHANEGFAETEFGPSIIYNNDTDTAVGNAVGGKKSKKDTTDCLTSVIGEFGLFQKVWCSLMGSTGLVIGWLTLSNKFLTTQVCYSLLLLIPLMLLFSYHCSHFTLLTLLCLLHFAYFRLLALHCFLLIAYFALLALLTLICLLCFAYFALLTSLCLLCFAYFAYFALHTSLCLLHFAYFALLTLCCLLCFEYFALLTSFCLLRVAYFALLT